MARRQNDFPVEPTSFLSVFGTKRNIWICLLFGAARRMSIASERVGPKWPNLGI